MVDCIGLENRRTERYRGFESLSLRKELNQAIGWVLFFVWVSILVFSYKRKKTDLRAADLIGGDVQEAYNFGMIGLVVVDV